MDPSRGLSFESDRFDDKSELPEDYNAGNRLYGRDFAQFLAEALTLGGPLGLFGRGLRMACSHDARRLDRFHLNRA